VQLLDFGERDEEKHTSPLTPIGRFIDFVTPDPPAGHDLQILVDAYLHDTDPSLKQLHQAQLENIFRTWVATAPQLSQLVATRPILMEESERSAQLSELGLLGLQSISYIETKAAPSADWLSNENQLIAKATQHSGMVDFVILTPLKTLVDAAAKP
jgi:hexosaminidase